jgi:hypothetical protein
VTTLNGIKIVSLGMPSGFEPSGQRADQQPRPQRRLRVGDLHGRQPDPGDDRRRGVPHAARRWAADPALGFCTDDNKSSGSHDGVYVVPGFVSTFIHP